MKREHKKEEKKYERTHTHTQNPVCTEQEYNEWIQQLRVLQFSKLSHFVINDFTNNWYNEIWYDRRWVEGQNVHWKSIYITTIHFFCSLSILSIFPLSCRLLLLWLVPFHDSYAGLTQRVLDFFPISFISIFFNCIIHGG